MPIKSAEAKTNKQKNNNKSVSPEGCKTEFFGHERGENGSFLPYKSSLLLRFDLYTYKAVRLCPTRLCRVN